MHPASDGTLSLGSSCELAIADEPDDPAVPRAILRRAIRFVPAIEDAPVLSAWWGVRPMSPDDRPLVGPLREGLVLATGHGAEGVLLGAGTASLVRSIVAGEEPPFDPAPFDPGRFG
jgi:sarcosine oxidase subunit beta